MIITSVRTRLVQTQGMLDRRQFTPSQVQGVVVRMVRRVMTGRHRDRLGLMIRRMAPLLSTRRTRTGEVKYNSWGINLFLKN